MCCPVFYLVGSLQVSKTCPRYSEVWGVGGAFRSLTHCPAGCLQQHAQRQTFRWTPVSLVPLLEIPLTIWSSCESEIGENHQQTRSEQVPCSGRACSNSFIPNLSLKSEWLRFDHLNDTQDKMPFSLWSPGILQLLMVLHWYICAYIYIYIYLICQHFSFPVYAACC